MVLNLVEPFLDFMYLSLSSLHSSLYLSNNLRLSQSAPSHLLEAVPYLVSLNQTEQLTAQVFAISTPDSI